IIDFDEEYVYRFTSDENTCDRLKIDSGDLNDVLIVTYHDGDNSWQNGLHFKWKNHPDHLILEDNNHFETDFYSTNLNDALNIRDKKKIIDY
ncbi:MAG: PASTA domain-containing protein, partial [Oscillospiraceae bacterium]|nr:PASTA domain-containing protein [Oscillospiraceae bacterium]